MTDNAENNEESLAESKQEILWEIIHALAETDWSKTGLTEDEILLVTKLAEIRLRFGNMLMDNPKVGQLRALGLESQFGSLIYAAQCMIMAQSVERNIRNWHLFQG